MTENEFILMDRLQKIRQIINKYGAENFYISYSGGKDSCVLDMLFHEALGKDDTILRVYIDTGIDYNAMRQFVRNKAQKEPLKYIFIKPKVNVKKTLEEYGYPFKSKEHSQYLSIYQKNGLTKTSMRYLYPAESRKSFGCPDILKYQFGIGNAANDFNLKISDQCCLKMKEEPLRKWQQENNKSIAIVGIRRAEKGRRINSQCTVFSDDSCKELIKFQPLAPISDEWEEWYIKSRHIELCELYDLGWSRTGCKGCPFDHQLQKTLDRLGLYYPNELLQTERLWAKPYQEYRRIGYRLKDSGPEVDGQQMSIFNYISM